MVESSRTELRQRKYVYTAIVVIFFVILYIGFFQIQVAGSERYYEMSLDNSIRQLKEYPERGIIRDITGRILVDNRPSFIVSVIPRQLSAETLFRLAAILKEDQESIKEKIRGKYTFRPVIIMRDLDYQTVVTLEEQRLDLPGVLLEVESKRYYADGVNSPHLFGYVGEVSQSEAESRKDLDPGEMVGKSGIELKYDSNLRGTKGVRFVKVDAEGRDLGTFDPDRNIHAVPGMDLYLTLDYKFQQFAESLMVGNRGAIIALDVRDGSVLTFVSKPDYDPRLLTGKISADVWNTLQSDSSNPMYNRVIQSRYPPGSTYKLVAAIAALQEKIITPEWKAYCPGYFRLGRKVVHCWNAKGHGEIKLLQAIKGSCNVYFFKLGLEIGLETWAEYSKKLFFGEPTGIDLPNESDGLVPTVEYFNRVYGPNGWTKGNLANLAIGQGELLTTPIQMAQLAMILANKGVVHRPHIAAYLLDRKTNRKSEFPVQTSYVTGISDDVYDLVRAGMKMVVDGGTGWRGRVPGIEVAGKTGTAQNPHGDDHAWFIAFAPYENPTIAIAVIVENAGHGGTVAAPMAEKCMEYYFYGKILPRAVAKKDTTAVADSMENALRLDLNNIDPIQISIPDTM
jgi:penicillin-binding protein 2